MSLAKLIPFPVRVELARLRRLPAWTIEHKAMALKRADAVSLNRLSAVVLSEHSSPLRRKHVSNEKLQAGKQHNVATAARKLDGIVIQPGQIFSYHHAIGRPSRLRGFRIGLELRDGREGSGIGGGSCQVSNLLYLMAISAGMEIVERHRHGLDLFPDHARTVPFGCGATIFYNYADLRFRNVLAEPVLLRANVREGKLFASLSCQTDPGFKVEIYEVDHEFHKTGDSWFRENHVWRRFIDKEGKTIREEELAHNIGRCLYDPGAQD